MTWVQFTAGAAGAQGIVCLVLSALCAWRLVARRADYREALVLRAQVKTSTDPARLDEMARFAIHWEIVLGVAIAFLGEAAHNLVSVYALANSLPAWPYPMASLARAIEIAGMLFAVRAVTVRHACGEWAWAGTAALGAFAWALVWRAM